MINKHTNTSLIFITFRSHYFFAAQYFHKVLYCGVYVLECMFPLCVCVCVCVCVFMGIPLYCFFGEEVLWNFLNSVFPSKSSSSRLNWKASALRLYVPAGCSSYGKFLYVSYICMSMSTCAVCVDAEPPKCIPYGLLGGWLLHAESYACTSD